MNLTVTELSGLGRVLAGGVGSQHGRTANDHSFEHHQSCGILVRILLHFSWSWFFLGLVWAFSLKARHKTNPAGAALRILASQYLMGRRVEGSWGLGQKGRLGDLGPKCTCLCTWKGTGVYVIRGIMGVKAGDGRIARQLVTPLEETMGIFCWANSSTGNLHQEQHGRLLRILYSRACILFAAVTCAELFGVLCRRARLEMLLL